MLAANFNKLAKSGYNRIPVVLETFADLDSALSIYMKLGNGAFSYFLESVQGGERFARYSFIGLPCNERICVNKNTLTHIKGASVISEIKTDNPLDNIRQFIKSLNVAPCPIDTRFSGGLVGYFGYDTIRYIEPKLTKGRKKPTTPSTQLPDILLLLSEELAVLDNLTGKLSLVVYADPSTPDALAKANEKLIELLKKLRTPLILPKSLAKSQLAPKYQVSQESFIQSVKVAKEYIAAGDVFQVVLSHALESPFFADPLTFYRALRSINPSPYMYFYNFDDFHVVGCSPEILVRMQDGTVTVRPLAGTRARGANEAEDQALAKDLLADEKECAEHMMLLDLGRNDAGRISKSGTVKVTEEMLIERYSHVMHMVSNVEGKVRDGNDAMSVLAATFPAGTLSGAPKVRAMEIIDELEVEARGVYSGAVGYIGFNGDMDVAIAIRTAVIKDNTIRMQAGAGIVADSDPQLEWLETQNKAQALISAAEMAVNGLDTANIDK